MPIGGRVMQWNILVISACTYVKAEADGPLGCMGAKSVSGGCKFLWCYLKQWFYRISLKLKVNTPFLFKPKYLGYGYNYAYQQIKVSI